MALTPGKKSVAEKHDSCTTRATSGSRRARKAESGEHRQGAGQVPAVLQGGEAAVTTSQRLKAAAVREGMLNLAPHDGEGMAGKRWRHRVAREYPAGAQTGRTPPNATKRAEARQA